LKAGSTEGLLLAAEKLRGGHELKLSAQSKAERGYRLALGKNGGSTEPEKARPAASPARKAAGSHSMEDEERHGHRQNAHDDGRKADNFPIRDAARQLHQCRQDHGRPRLRSCALRQVITSSSPSPSRLSEEEGYCPTWARTRASSSA